MSVPYHRKPVKSLSSQASEVYIIINTILQNRRSAQLKTTQLRREKNIQSKRRVYENSENAKIELKPIIDVLNV